LREVKNHTAIIAHGITAGKPGNIKHGVWRVVPCFAQ